MKRKPVFLIFSPFISGERMNVIPVSPSWERVEDFLCCIFRVLGLGNGAGSAMIVLEAGHWSGDGYNVPTGM
jgi:hypothetical protein